MESPFYPSTSAINSGSFALYLEPILDSYSQTYQQIITLSCMPLGPLASMVKTMSLPKLSPFASYTNTRSEFECSYILLRYPNGFSNPKKKYDYMYSHDIPAVFSYLKNNGYIIDNSVTKMMNGSRVLVGNGCCFSGSNDKRLICFVSFTPCSMV
jgi:hypothetical protein